MATSSTDHSLWHLHEAGRKILHHDQQELLKAQENSSNESGSGPGSSSRWERGPGRVLRRTVSSDHEVNELNKLASDANQASSLAYDSESWKATIKVLGTGGDLVLYPWAILTAASVVVAIIDSFLTKDHVLSIPDEVVVVLGGTMSLLLAFRLNSSYSRWWEARNLWGDVIVASRILTQELMTDARNVGKEAMQVQVAAWCVAFAVSLKCHLRGEPLPRPEPRPPAAGHGGHRLTITEAVEAVQTLSSGDRGLRLLDETDLDALLSSKHAPLYALARLRQTVRATTREQGAGLEINLFGMQRTLVGALTGCERILRTPCPPGYVGMLRSVMVVWLCFLPFTLVDALGLGMVPVYSMTTWLVLKIEGLAVEIENPFGTDFNDLPLEAFCLTVEADALRTMNELDALEEAEDEEEVAAATAAAAAQAAAAEARAAAAAATATASGHRSHSGLAHHRQSPSLDVALGV